MLRSYDAMTATARRHPEGSLVYVIDQTDLYLRVRDGVRQVYVNARLSLSSHIRRRDKNPLMLTQLFLCFQLGSFIALPSEDVSALSPLVSPL